MSFRHLIVVCAVLLVLNAWADIWHTVQAGDTLEGIGKRYRVTSREIVNVNHLVAKDRLTIGQRLQIPRVMRYRVRSGDSLAVIARRFGVTADELARMNQLTATGRLAINQMLYIFSPPVSNGKAPKPGQTLEKATKPEPVKKTATVTKPELVKKTATVTKPEPVKKTATVTKPELVKTGEPIKKPTPDKFTKPVQKPVSVKTTEPVKSPNEIASPEPTKPPEPEKTPTAVKAPAATGLQLATFTVTPATLKSGWYEVKDTVRVAAEAHGATRVEFWCAPAGIKQAPILLNVGQSGKEEWSTNWLVPLHSSWHLWAVAYNESGNHVSSDLLHIYRE